MAIVPVMPIADVSMDVRVETILRALARSTTKGFRLWRV
jgi:hypothetical protein